MHDKNYEDLANAIIIQAVKDYRGTQSPQVRNEIKRFFKSQWFSMLTNVDGDKLISIIFTLSKVVRYCLHNIFSRGR